MMNHMHLITVIVKLTSISRSSLRDYIDAYILVSETIAVSVTAAAGANPNNRKNIIVRNCTCFY